MDTKPNAHAAGGHVRIRSLRVQGGGEVTDTYETPKHGWTCYHCGETFTTWGSAEDHFGKTPAAKPGCLIKVQFGNERGLEMELRKVEALAEEYLNRALRAEDREQSLSGRVAEFERIAGGGAHELRMKLDSMQGLVITADALIVWVREKAPELYAEIVG